ncbi:MAG: enoyl-CoA hydratase/isomerase family protein [Gammaproteobacteria bacterium]|nr:enoyl-CoA hydratase/isomerase family protein [Gammaproteobacteria bacterium]
MTTEDNNAPVLIETLPSGGGYRVGLATLNAPKSLNALTRDMVDILLPQLQQWQADDSIACVVLRGSGDKGFCAGGDVVQLRNSSLAGDGAAAAFFEQEYRLDYLIHTYSKPIVVWGHGIVMGGGLGLLAGASHRVVTAKTRLAMPEVTIGLYPDVGGSWFLNKMPGRSGLFVALTGVSINAGDTLYLGLADHFLAHEQWAEFIAALGDMSWAEPVSHSVDLTRLLQGLSTSAGEPPVSAVREHYDVIQAMTAGPTLEEIVSAITAYSGDDKWLAGAAKTLASGCPTTVYLIAEQLKRSLHMSLREAFQMELVLSANCMGFPNFAEGVRALLVDKDQQPKFEPATLAAVTPELVAAHFVPPWDGANPLDDL